jgi:hypothetical protein
VSNTKGNNCDGSQKKKKKKKKRRRNEDGKLRRAAGAVLTVRTVDRGGENGGETIVGGLLTQARGGGGGGGRVHKHAVGETVSATIKVQTLVSALALLPSEGNDGASTAAAAAGKGGKGGRRSYSCQLSIASRELFDGDDENYSNDQGNKEDRSLLPKRISWMNEN